MQDDASNQNAVGTPPASVLVTFIANPWDPVNSRKVKRLAWRPGKSVSAYVTGFFDPGTADLDLVVGLSGRVVPQAEQDRVCPRPGDWLAFCAVPRGDGGGGKNIARAVAMIAVLAVAVAAPFAIAALTGGTLLTFAGMNAGATMTMYSGAAFALGSTLVNAVLPPARPDAPNLSGSSLGSGFEQSRSYGWTPADNPVQEGLPLPAVYGSVRTVPLLISRHTETSGDKQYLNLLFALADGEVDSVSDIRINDNPVSNYKDIAWQWRSGDLDQAPIPYFNDTCQDRAANMKLSSGSWAAIKVPGAAAQGLGVGFLMPAGLYFANDSGGLSKIPLTVRLQYRRDQGEWRTWRDVEISEARQGPVRKFVSLRDLEPGEYEVRADLVKSPDDLWDAAAEYKKGDLVTYDGAYYAARADQAPGRRPDMYDGGRGWAELAHSRVRFDIYLEYVQSMIPDDFAYPGVALLGVNALAADQLSGSQPRVTCLVSRNTVPVLDPETGEYQDRPADNPAWACYDILHNSRYGAGVDVSRINLAEFKSWAAWCEEKNLKCNIHFDSAMSLAAGLSHVSMVGRGMIVQRGANFGCMVDRPSDPVQMFTVGNIAADSFKESFLEKKDRANCAEVTYFDAEKDHARQVVEVRAEDFDSETEEIRKSQVTLYGCTDRDMAVRHGRFLLNCNRCLVRTVSFEADVDAVACQVGDVILVSHDVPQWGYSGRVVAADQNSVTLDREVVLNPETEYRVVVRSFEDDSLEERPVLGVQTETATDVLPLSEPWDRVPQTHDLYSFGESGRATKPFRVIAITRSQDLKRKITALEYRDEVYADQGDTLDFAQETDLCPVRDISAREVWELGSDGSGTSVIVLSWRGTAVSWRVFCREVGGAWSLAARTSTPSAEVRSPAPGKTYEVAVSPDDNPEHGRTMILTVMGKDAPPGDVAGFTARRENGRIEMTWKHVSDIDLWGYEIREGQAWESSRTVVDGVQENRAAFTPPTDGTYKLWIKAVDLSGNFSRTPAWAMVDADIESGLNIILDTDEFSLSPACPGNVQDMVYCPSEQALMLIEGMSDADCPELTDQDLDYAGDQDRRGGYECAPVDLGRVADFSLRAATVFESGLRTATDRTIPERTDQDRPLDTDRAISSNAAWSARYRASQDNLAWSEYKDLSGPVSLKARYYQIRWDADMDTDAAWFRFKSLRHMADVQEIQAKYDNRAVDAAGTVFVLADLGLEFFSEYYVGVTVLGSGPGYPVVDKTADSFTVRLFDPAGNGLAGNVDLSVRGF